MMWEKQGYSFSLVMKVKCRAATYIFTRRESTSVYLTRHITRNWLIRVTSSTPSLFYSGDKSCSVVAPPRWEGYKYKPVTKRTCVTVASPSPTNSSLIFFFTELLMRYLTLPTDICGPLQFSKAAPLILALLHFWEGLSCSVRKHGFHTLWISQYLRSTKFKRCVGLIECTWPTVVLDVVSTVLKCCSCCIIFLFTRPRFSISSWFSLLVL